MSRDVSLYLNDILASGRAIQRYLCNTSYEDFLADRMRQSAVIREFEIIGEAVSKLPDDLKGREKDIPWQDIKDFRNLLVHEYFGVDLLIVWKVVEEDLSPLLAAVERLVNNR
ncbi:MAG: DUF86 domain-containing protein [Geothermobacteraceae bacterium]